MLRLRGFDSVNGHRGYYIIDPGLCAEEYSLSLDKQAQCLSFLISKIFESGLMPDGAHFRIIPVQYVGDGFPAIGMYMKEVVNNPTELTTYSLKIGVYLEGILEEFGLDRLQELSIGQNINWQDVQSKYTDDWA